jgi:hypothetical protein
MTHAGQIMWTPIDAERRRSIRRLPAADEPLSRVRLRTGRELLVVDVSDMGALVEGTVRLLPGTHVDVHVVTRDGRILVRSRVARCSIVALKADAVSYRGVLVFDRQVDTAQVGGTRIERLYDGGVEPIA